jgi:hypothetical protein
MPHHKDGFIRFVAYRYAPEVGLESTHLTWGDKNPPLWTTEIPYLLPPPHFEPDTPGPHWKPLDEPNMFTCDLTPAQLIAEPWEFVGNLRPLTMELSRPKNADKPLPIPWLRLDLQKAVVKGTEDQPMAFYIGRRYGLRRLALRISKPYFPEGFYDI